MLTNYLKKAFRNLSANKPFAFVSMPGLGAGLAAFIALTLVIRFETGFDTFNRNYDKIYRLVTVIHFPDGTKYIGDVPYAIPQGLRTDYPNLRDVPRPPGLRPALPITRCDTRAIDRSGQPLYQKRTVARHKPSQPLNYQNAMHMANFLTAILRPSSGKRRSVSARSWGPAPARSSPIGQSFSKSAIGIKKHLHVQKPVNRCPPQLPT